MHGVGLGLHLYTCGTVPYDKSDGQPDEPANYRCALAASNECPNDTKQGPHVDTDSSGCDATADCITKQHPFCFAFHASAVFLAHGTDYKPNE